MTDPRSTVEQLAAALADENAQLRAELAARDDDVRVLHLQLRVIRSTWPRPATAIPAPRVPIHEEIRRAQRHR